MSRGRYSRTQSHDHAIELLRPGEYRISWIVDRFYASSRLRHEVGHQRVTDTAGAKRFARRWKLEVPTQTRAQLREAAGQRLVAAGGAAPGMAGMPRRRGP